MNIELLNTNSSDSTPGPRNWTSAVTFIALLVIFLVINLVMAAPYVLAITMGGILALLSYPLYKKLRARNLKPLWAGATVTTGVALLILAPLLAFCTLAIQQGSEMAQAALADKRFSTENISSLMGRVEGVGLILGNRAELETKISTAIQNGAKVVSQAGLSFLTSLPEIGLQVALALLSCFFFLIDGRRLLFWLNDKIPLEWDVRACIYASFRDTAVSGIWAGLAAASAQAALMLGGFLAFGVPGAFLAGGATFIFAWVPILGSAPVWLAGAAYLLFEGKIPAMILMIALGVFTSLVDNYIRPLILKGQSDMHPLVSLVAIFGGISLFGIFGVIVGPVLTAILLTLLQIWPVVGKRFGFVSVSKMDTLERSAH